MNYTLNQLQIFLKIVEKQSITKASKALHLTQPAVSIQLKNFQNQFDIPLTEVIGRKLYVTEFGREVAEAAENILNQVYAINYKTSAYKGRLTGRLKISVVSTGKYVMPYYLSDFLDLNPDIDLSMDVTNINRVTEALENNEIDFALISIFPSSLNIDRLDLIQNKLYLVGKQLPQGSLAMNTKEIFHNMRLIFREKGSGTRQIMEKFVKSGNMSFLKKMELTSNEAVKQALIAGLGYSIMPLIGLKNELRNGELQIIPVEGLPIVSTWSLVWLKDKKHSPTSLSFLKYLNNEKAHIKQEKFSWYEAY